MDYRPTSPRLLPILIATILFLFPLKAPAEIQSDLFWAIDKNNPSQISKLLRKGADPNIPNNEGYTPLMLVTQTGNLELVQIFIEAGANLNARNKYGETAIMLASYHGQTGMVKQFYAKGT